METNDYYTRAQAAECMGLSVARVDQITGDENSAARYGWQIIKVGNAAFIPKVAVHAYMRNPPKRGRQRKVANGNS